MKTTLASRVSKFFAPFMVIIWVDGQKLPPGPRSEGDKAERVRIRKLGGFGVCSPGKSFKFEFLNSWKCVRNCANHVFVSFVLWFGYVRKESLKGKKTLWTKLPRSVGTKAPQASPPAWFLMEWVHISERKSEVLWEKKTPYGVSAPHSEAT